MRRVLGIAAAAAALTTLALAQGGAALTRDALADYFFGPKLVRAEVVMMDGGVLHDYRVDRGKIRTITPSTLTLSLLEKDGTTVSVPVASTAEIRLNGILVPFSRLRKGFTATTVREGSAPATKVQATRR
jgi:hypothetical protein